MSFFEILLLLIKFSESVEIVQNSKTLYIRLDLSSLCMYNCTFYVFIS